MRCLLWLISLLLFFPCTTLFGNTPQAVLVEAESFSNPGGWVVDQQSMDIMGSPYLMAHGMGIPVADASTNVKFPATGRYRLFVRTRNWTGRWI